MFHKPNYVGAYEMPINEIEEICYGYFKGGNLIKKQRVR